MPSTVCRTGAGFLATSTLVLALACGGGGSSTPAASTAQVYPMATYQGAEDAVGSFVTLGSFAQAPSSVSTSVPAAAAAFLPVPRVAARAAAAGCPAVTFDPTGATLLTLDFSNCPGFGGSIVYTLVASPAGGGLGLNVAFNAFTYSYTSGGGTYSGSMQGTFTVSPASGGAYLVSTPSLQGLTLTSSSPAGSHAYTVSLGLYLTPPANGSTTMTEYGMAQYTEGNATLTLSASQATPLTWNLGSGCAYPSSGIVTYSAPGGVLLTGSFGSPCGTVTFAPDNVVSVL